MKQISGNKLLVKALKEEGVEYLFGYPGACTIDISDELYKQDDVKIILPRHEQALVHEADACETSNIGKRNLQIDHLENQKDCCSDQDRKGRSLTDSSLDITDKHM